MDRVFRGLLVLLLLLLGGHDLARATGPAPPGAAWLGIEMEAVATAGVVVRHVFEGSPAEQVGLRAGDVLQRVDDRALSEPEHLVAHVGGRRPGERVWLVVERAGRAETKQVVLGLHPGLDYLDRGIFLDKPARPLGKLRPVSGQVPRKLEALRGRVVLINFFAGWCEACQAMAPKLNEWHERYGPLGLTILGVTHDTPAVVSSTIKSWSLPFPVAIDVGKSTAEIYRVRTLPTVHIVDRRGVTREVRGGADAGATIEMERLIQELLAER